MYILREAKKSDLESLHLLAKVGIPSLPPQLNALSKKIELSITSFKKATDGPGEEYYLFTLEEFETGRIVGTSAIRATAPSFPMFLKLTEPLPTVEIPHPTTTTLLKLRTERPDASELCGLVLDENVQSKGLGHLLSRSRFFFMADHLTRFHNTVIADLRGVITPEGVCLFWEEIGRSFCPFSFPEMEELYRTKPAELYSLIPRHSIYLSLLSKEVQEATGAVHSKTAPALKMLLKEGFHITDEIHPLDGGPRLRANMLDVRSIREGKIGLLTNEKLENSFPALISTTLSPFRACISDMAELPHGRITFSENTKNALEGEVGKHFRYLKL